MAVQPLYSNDQNKNSMRKAGFMQPISGGVKTGKNDMSVGDVLSSTAGGIADDALGTATAIRKSPQIAKNALLGAGAGLYNMANQKPGMRTPQQPLTGDQLGGRMKSALPVLGGALAMPGRVIGSELYDAMNGQSSLPPLGKANVTQPAVAKPSLVSSETQNVQQSVIPRAGQGITQPSILENQDTAKQPSDEQLMRFQNTSDTGIPYQQSTDGNIQFTNHDGTGYGTIDWGSRERNNEMAAKLHDGKGAIFKGGSLPDVRPELAQPQLAPQLQMPSINQGGSAYDDEIARTLDMIDQNMPDRMDSVGQSIAKRRALHGLTTRLQALQSAQGNILQSQDRSNALNANIGLSNQHAQTEAANAQAQSVSDMLKLRQSQDQFNAQNQIEQGKLALEQQKAGAEKYIPYYETVIDPETQMPIKRLAGGFNTATGMPVIPNAGKIQEQQTVRPFKAGTTPEHINYAYDQKIANNPQQKETLEKERMQALQKLQKELGK